MYAKSEHVRPGDRAALVDEVMGLPEVKASDRMEASVPLGDAESVERLRERTDDAVLPGRGQHHAARRQPAAGRRAADFYR